MTGPYHLQHPDLTARVEYLYGSRGAGDDEPVKKVVQWHQQDRCGASPPASRMRTDERRNMGWLDWDEFAKEYDGVFLGDPVYTKMLEMVLEQVEGGNAS